MNNNELRIAGTANDSIVDGPGIRFAVFTQGCPHRCPGCHNPQTHDFGGGKTVTVQSLVTKIKNNPLLDGVTFSGGEPFCQPFPLAELAGEVHARGLDIVTYTGYTFEYLYENASEENGFRELLMCTDILVDGPFIESERSIELLFRGSRNQRILDCRKSMECGIPVPYDISAFQ